MLFPKKKEERINDKDIFWEDSLAHFTSNAENPFTIEEVIQHIAKETQESPKDYNHVIKLLEKDPYIFWNSEKEIGIPRSHYFHHVTFRVLPRAEEIRQGILVPGHRFMPFCSKDILPCDCKLLWEQKNILSEKMNWKLDDILIYHSLMGPQGFSLYLKKQDKKKQEKFESLEDFPLNWLPFLFHLQEKKKVSLKVFNIADFYKKYDFQAGDTLLFTVEDWKKGIYTISYSPASDLEKQKKECDVWIEKLEEALIKVFQEKKKIFHAEEQLAKAFFLAGKEIFSFPGYNIGSFLEKSQKIELQNDFIYTYLWYKGKKATLSLPDDLSWEDGYVEKYLGMSKEEELEEILMCLQTPISPYVLKIYMLDELYAGSKKVDSCLTRCFPKLSSSNFINKEQEKKFYQLINTLWQTTKKSYNIAKDKYTGECRSKLLKLYDMYLVWEKRYREEPLNFPLAFLEKLSTFPYSLEDLAMEYSSELCLTKPESEEEMKKIEEKEKEFEVLKQEMDKKQKENDAKIAKKKGKVSDKKEKSSIKKTSKKETESSTGNIYQLKISLIDTEPLVWRTVQVKKETTLQELHDIIQDVMGWEGYHLYSFEIGRENYGPEDDNSDNIPLCNVIQKPKQKIHYMYDFGDSWEHEILLEKILSLEKGVKYPVCIAGENACPPEDCGGIPGYYNLLESIEDPENEEYEEHLEWLGDDFDPSAFDLKETNKRLKK